MNKLAPYISYVQEYSRHQSTVGIRCDRCGKIIDCFCDEVFSDEDFFFECPNCNYSDWISTIGIAKEIKAKMVKHGFNPYHHD